MEKMWEQWVERYSLPLFRWALGKSGSRTEAEDLAQEIWLQFFSAAKKQKVEQPEHLLFRIARFVWCKGLRNKRGEHSLPDHLSAPDFADGLADSDEEKAQIRWLHEKITRMSYLHREAMILYYIEQMPQKQIAAKLHLTESTVRWYLFDTRRKLREETKTMHTTPAHAYRPRRMTLGVNGIVAPELATKQIEQNLLMQNILIACWEEPRTAEEVAQYLGVACAYVEHELEWLKEQEFVTEEKGRFATSFLISTKEYENKIVRMYEKHKAPLIDKIVQFMLEHEEDIRKIGFVGCDRPMNKLLWLLLYQFTRSIKMPITVPERPFRPDGGRYWPLGFVRDENVESLRAGWGYNGTMFIGDFFWFGLYDFGNSEIEHLMDAYTPYWHGLRELLRKLIRAEFALDCVTEDEKETLAALIEKGFVIREENGLRPNFVIFTAAQYDLFFRNIIHPLEAQLQGALQALAQDMEQLCRAYLPRHAGHLTPVSLSQAMTNLDFEAEFLAFQDGHLYRPKDKRDGEFLTLAYLLQ